MQLPRNDTPISRCLELATYANRMLSKFPDSPTLAENAQRMHEGGQALAAAHGVHEAARAQGLALRVDVGYEDYLADQQVRRTQQLAEIADGRRGGRIAAQLFPTGSTPITRLRGDSQVTAMLDLEARLNAANDIWPGAEAARAALEARRIRYQEVLAARQDNLRNVKDLRTARDAAKERFLDVYAQVANLVHAEFPRDRMLQNLFFDEVRRARRAAKPAPEPTPAPAPALAAHGDAA